MCDTPKPCVEAYKVLGCTADFNGLYKFQGRFCNKRPVFEKEESNSAIFYYVTYVGFLGFSGGSGWSLATIFPDHWGDTSSWVHGPCGNIRYMAVYQDGDTVLPPESGWKCAPGADKVRARFLPMPLRPSLGTWTSGAPAQLREAKARSRSPIRRCKQGPRRVASSASTSPWQSSSTSFLRSRPLSLAPPPCPPPPPAKPMRDEPAACAFAARPASTASSELVRLNKFTTPAGAYKPITLMRTTTAPKASARPSKSCPPSKAGTEDFINRGTPAVPFFRPLIPPGMPVLHSHARPAAAQANVPDPPAAAAQRIAKPKHGPPGSW